MAKAKQSAADEIRPVEGFTPIEEFGGGAASGVDLMHSIGKTLEAAATLPSVPEEPDPRDAEIAALRAKLAAYEEAAPTVAGGRWILSWKDGPTVTILVNPGERPEDALSRYGVHSVPHKIQCRPAGPNDPIGRHSPGGVRPFGPTAAS